jgi:hypothetical protein
MSSLRHCSKLGAVSLFEKRKEDGNHKYKTSEHTNILNSYFQSQGVSPPAEQGKDALEKMFDSYRGKSLKVDILKEQG